MPEGTYNPWYRRWFTNEKSREIAETFELYDAVARLNRERGTTFEQETTRIVRQLGEHTPPGFPFANAFIRAIIDLVQDEAYMFDMPPRSVDGFTLTEFVQFREFLYKKQRYLANQQQYRTLLDDCLVGLFAGLAQALPETESPSPFTIPLINACSQPQAIVQHIYSSFQNPAFIERGLFDPIAAQLSRNLTEVSGVPYDEPNPRKPLKFPIDSKLPLDELQHAYLRGTVFDNLLSLPVPLRLTHQDRFSHMHIIGGTGAGKTTLLENLILHDLKSENPPALVIIDSQGDLIRKISQLALWNDLPDPILISPKDVHYPPALNVFAVNRERLSQYDQATREQIIAGVIQTFDYLFAGLIGADLTAKQGVFFKFIARLMLALPDTLGRNATILDMIALMEDVTPYRAAITSLPAIQRNFFERDFQSKTFVQTKEQIRYRLHAIIENPTLARLFTSPDTKLDLFSELNQGSVILVDTAKDFLKGSSAHFGQIFISLVLQAVLERAALPEWQRRDTFLIVDEAAEYFDSNIDDLLTETRKQKLGCVFAHQYLDQCTSSLRASLAANTSIKFAAGVSTNDARAMAPELRTTPDFILDQPRLHFAAHIRNVTPQAVSIPVQPGALDREPRLSASEYQDFIERNRERVAYEAPSSLSPPAGQALPPEDEDVSDKW